jgi:exopolyphosphatase/guanosine-5'-triphosphate,3'-diphosphate pyrophosphatase
MHRVATIDCGTNTLLLLIVEVDGRGLRTLEDRAEIVRLGEGLDRSGRLTEAAIGRTLEALHGYAERIAAFRCDHVLAVGTEALRKAQNGQQFLKKADDILRPLGGRFEVIDGEREAALCFSAVRASFPALTGQRTVVDIGGGSTELIVGDETIEHLVSLPIGSVRLTERLLHHDPPTEAEKKFLIETIDHALDAAPHLCRPLVGIAGTVTTLSAMAQGLGTYDGGRVHGSTLERPVLEELIERLGRQPIEDRRRTPGLDPKRADVIYAGSVLLERVMHRANADQCLVSDRGIRWGLAYEAQ